MDKGYKQEDIYKWIHKLYSDNKMWTNPSKITLFSALHQIKSNCKRLKKNRFTSQVEALEKFLQSPFPLPSTPKGSRTKQNAEKPSKKKTVCTECSVLDETVTKLANELHEQNMVAEEAVRKATELEKEQKVLKNCLRKYKQSIKRKERQMSKIKTELKAQGKRQAQTEKLLLLKKVSRLHAHVRSLQTRMRNTRYRNKIKQNRSQVCSPSHLKERLRQAQNRVASLEVKNSALMEKLGKEE